MTPEQLAAFQKFCRENGILPMGDPEEVAAALNSQRPKIRLPGDNRELGQFAREVGEILTRQNLFRRDTLVVTVNADEGRTDEVSAEWLRTWAENHLVCFKDKSVGAGEGSYAIQVVKTMNADTARATLAASQFLDQIRKIVRVNPIRLPMMTHDQRIELAPLGYCSDNRVFTLENDLVFDESMTAEQGAQIIRELLSEFPFADSGRSLAVQVAAMMTVFGAGLLPSTAARPGFIYTANDSDAGKTLAVKVAIIPILGRMNTRAFPRKEELRKVLDQIAMEGKVTMLFDNVKGTLGGEEIEAFMSTPRWSGRILGEKGGFDVENVTTCFFTGNDSKPTRDMAQRCLFVELYLEEVDSSQRTIRRLLNDAVLAETGLRSAVCSALWALVKAWDAAGRPGPTSIMPKCPEWSAIIGAIVEHAGFGGVFVKPETTGSGFVRDMELLVRALHAKGGDQKWGFDHLADVVKEHELFQDGSFFASGRSDGVEIFDKEGAMTAAAKSAFGIKLASFGKVSGHANGRLVRGEGGTPLRFRVIGKGHSKKFVVSRDGVADAAIGDGTASEATLDL